ncbi:MAG: hypothetical protein B7X11_03725 [Acidobacteria bacterium 37-65-4]|nr:MAG: hypothetical protein B7X11_03725 [Acidobacteria bacterium 37-65-4]
MVPGAGDEVQALKAGIMEIADIFVVNKADRDGADRTAASIEAMLALETWDEAEWKPPVMRTEATANDSPARSRPSTARASSSRARQRASPALAGTASRMCSRWSDSGIVQRPGSAWYAARTSASLTRAGACTKRRYASSARRVSASARTWAFRSQPRAASERSYASLPARFAIAARSAPAAARSRTRPRSRPPSTLSCWRMRPSSTSRCSASSLSGGSAPW